MRPKKRAVLDTNVLVSALIAGGNNFPPAKLYKAFKDQEYILVTSLLILRDVDGVLRRDKIALKYGLTASKRKRAIEEMRALSIVTSGLLQVKVVEDDPDDDKFLSCAIEGGADYVVSGDKHLRVVSDYKGIKIITPRDFLNALKDSA